MPGGRSRREGYPPGYLLPVEKGICFLSSPDMAQICYFPTGYSRLGFKGNPSLLEICWFYFFPRGLKQMRDRVSWSFSAFVLFFWLVVSQVSLWPVAFVEPP